MKEAKLYAIGIGMWIAFLGGTAWMLLTYWPLEADAQVTIPVNALKLGWTYPDPNPNTTYKVYWGPATQVYTNSIVSGTNRTATLSNLFYGGTYFIMAAAISNGVERAYSNEIKHRVGWRAKRFVGLATDSMNYSNGPYVEMGSWTNQWWTTNVPNVKAQYGFMRIEDLNQ